MSYNWEREYNNNLWWVIRSHGFDPEDDELKCLLEDVFELGYLLCEVTNEDL